MAPIELLEVSPRDGLQNEAVSLSVAAKLSLIKRLVGDGARRIEIASFVDPRRVPQMADAEAVASGARHPEVVRIGLALNRRGGQRAIAAGIDEVGVVCVASDAFGIANQGQTSAESVAIAGEVIALALAAGRRAQATIAVAFGCPFSGNVDPARVVAIARTMADAGAQEIAVADTIGVAVPTDVTRLVAAIRFAVGSVPVRAHFHDTRGTGIANAWAAIEAGATTIDASVGGLGGCPFAPGAAGNVASEDVAYLLARSGMAFGRDADAMIDTARWVCAALGRQPASRLSAVSLYAPQEASS